MVGLVVAALVGVDDAVVTTFDLNAFARLCSQVRILSQPFVRPRHQHAATKPLAQLFTDFTHVLSIYSISNCSNPITDTAKRIILCVSDSLSTHWRHIYTVSQKKNKTLLMPITS